jgi:hypothetical protein
MLSVKFPVRWSILAVAEEGMFGMMLETNWWKLPKPLPPSPLDISMSLADDIVAPRTASIMSIMCGMPLPPAIRT